MSAVSKHSKEDAAAMCVPALTLAAGACYDTMGLNGVAKCPEQFDLTVEAENWEQKKLRGLWQIGEGYDVDVKKQADAVYTISPALPRGLRTLDAEVVVQDCKANGIPTV